MTGRIAAGVLVAVVVLALLGWVFILKAFPADAGSWAGVDEVVIEKYAAAAGRQASGPLINTDQGDLLLFLFALGGAAGGFVAGYCWRRLITEKKGRTQE